MATVNLGRIKPIFKGAYSGSTAYVVDDIVTHGDETFICIQAHAAGTQATSVTAYWSKLAAKGIDGTDVGTTITTQGDVLYRDGSGLARLAAGTSGQVLQTGGSGANPSWGTVSSDFVKLGQVTASDDSSVSLNNLFTSDYKIYKIYGREVVGASDNKSLRVKYRNSGGAISAAYYNSHFGIYNNSSSNSTLTNRHWNDSYINLSLNGLDVSNQYGLDFEMTFYDPQSSTRHKNYFGSTAHDVYDQTLIYAYSFGGFLKNTGIMTGFDFYMSSGNINGIFTMYGIKN